MIRQSGQRTAVGSKKDVRETETVMRTLRSGMEAVFHIAKPPKTYINEIVYSRGSTVHRNYTELGL